MAENLLELLPRLTEQDERDMDVRCALRFALFGTLRLSDAQ